MDEWVVCGEASAVVPRVVCWFADVATMECQGKLGLYVAGPLRPSSVIGQGDTEAWFCQHHCVGAAAFGWVRHE